MNTTFILKALADETRMCIVKLLLGHGYCVKSLAMRLNISEAAVSQHLKILREAELINGEKRSYFMHYDVDKVVLRNLAMSIDELADIEREECRCEHSACIQDGMQCMHGNSDDAHMTSANQCHPHRHHQSRSNCDCHHQKSEE